MKWLSLLILPVVCVATSDTMAMEIRVLSAGAVEPALIKVIEAFQYETGHHVKVAFATAPEIGKRLGAGDTVDVVLAPPPVLDDMVKAGNAVAADRVTVGRIGIGVAVRDNAPVPKIATVAEFRQSVLDAESIVYNRASTGTYLAELFDRLGIGEQTKAKTTRYPDFAAVLAHVTKGAGNEIGFGATTVIVEGKSQGLKFVGPLPAEIQNHTTYVATVVAKTAAMDAAVTLVRYLASPEAKAILKAAGIE
jgi:molybdate transport system substrate-binding protein